MRIKVASGQSLLGRALVAGGAGIYIPLLGDPTAAGRVDEVVGVGRAGLFLVRGLPEGDVQLILAQLLDGNGQRMLGAGVDLRSGDAEGVVEPQGRGVLVDLARPLGAGYGEAVARVYLAQKLVYLKVVQHSCLLLLWFPSSLRCRGGPLRGPRLRPRGRTRRGPRPPLRRSRAGSPGLPPSRSPCP